MAKKSESAEGLFRILEAQITLNPRGKSVANGTMLVDGEPEQFSQQLQAFEKSMLEKLLVSWLSRTKPV